MELSFELDDLTRESVRALVARHLAGMHAASPACSVHAFDAQKLRGPGVRFWSVWSGGTLAGMGALKTLDAENGELKSMRVADPFLGKGIGRAMLLHLLDEARKSGMKTVWLETGTGETFDAAHRLYESAGFVRCGPFADYREDAFSVFMNKKLPLPL